MKKLLSIAFAAGSIAAFAATSGTSIGVTEISSAYEDTIVGVSYAALDGSGNIAVADIVKTKNLTAGDILYVFGGESYTSWVLAEDANNAGVLIWSPMQIASGSGPVIAGVGASDATLAVGNAIFLHRQSTDDSFFVYGATTNAPAVSIAAGRNLVANTAQTNKNLSIANPSLGDTIILSNGTKYRYAGSKRGWGAEGGSAVDSISIPAGQGFWYIANKAGATVTFQ